MFTAKHQKYWLLASVGIFLLVSALFVFGVYKNIVNTRELARPIEEKLAQLGANKTRPNFDRSYNLQSILNARLFYVQTDTKQKVKAKKTKLRLKLEGIIAANDDKFSRAIISANNKKSITYSVGDKIKGTNAKLNKVESIRVLLSRAGALESLELERKKID